MLANITNLLATFISDLSLDAMDSAGDQHLHIDHNIYKRRVDLTGHPIEEAKKEDISKPTKVLKNVSNFFLFIAWYRAFVYFYYVT